MPIGVLFWVIYVIAILFGLWSSYEPANKTFAYRPAGAYIVLWLLVGLLGYAAFGPVVK